MPRFSAPIRGMHFHPPAKALLGCLPAGCALRMEREPLNEYDSNAIKVFALSETIPEIAHPNLDAMAAGYGFDLKTILAQPEWHLGYITKENAQDLAPMLDAGATASITLAFSPEGKPVGMIQVEEQPSD